MRIERKSHGIDQQEWIQQIEDRYSERQTLFPLESKQLKRLFDQDYSVVEVLLKELSKGHIRALM